ncbi:MAG: hypothetical protein R3B47_18785 [Bacteroidia bacterium]
MVVNESQYSGGSEKCLYYAVNPASDGAFDITYILLYAWQNGQAIHVDTSLGLESSNRPVASRGFGGFGFGDIIDAAGDAAGSVKDKVEDTAGKVKDTAEDAAGKVKDTVTGAAEQLQALRKKSGVESRTR